MMLVKRVSLAKKKLVQIGIISDTHGYFEPSLREFFKQCDEVWHAGDIGSMEVIQEMQVFPKIRAVYGNIDGTAVRQSFPSVMHFELEGIRVYLTHIGGYPGNYASGIKARLKELGTGLFVCGHSHILKVIPDPQLGLLHINPGAIGKNGFHQVRTAVRLKLSNGKPSELEVLEITR